jgi:hypothetical protein
MFARHRKKSGQSLLEYVLLLIVMAGAYSVIDNALRVQIATRWKNFAREIAAGCPTCDYPDSLQ